MGFTSIRVFGSVVRGDDSADSDVDLLVTIGLEVSSWFPAGLILDLENLLGRRVDNVTGSGVNAHIRDEILAQAVPL